MVFFPIFDPTFILLIPAIILSLYAQFKVQSTFERYSRVASRRGMTGAQVARDMLDRAGLHNVRVEMVQGFLSDHYDPRIKVLRLSPAVYQSSSLASLGVAAHEAGHALQHRTGYLPLQLRSALVPVVSFGSNLAIPLLLIGILLGLPSLARLGVYAFTLVVLFTLITLPVEFNASRRAVALLETGGYLSGQELVGARRVLNAAALTYVAAALTAVLNLVRFIILAGFLGRRDE
ncbi:MAG TPA: peptidase [Peptococcaceae bacterium]|nr:peptidase [Peptococcaceae bacterium]